jgi:ABC-type Fe3+-hydroxamate transport system substrate-binding protein/adenosylcobinamide amidohydrolase
VGSAASLFAYPVTFTDSTGTPVVLTNKPQRVVSLAPAVTEIIFQLGAGDAIVGLTYHDTRPPEVNHKTIVGGFLTPSPGQMEALDPDVIFLSSLHQEVRDHFAGRACRMIELDSRSVADLYRNIQVLGEVFEREEQAGEIIRNIRSDLQLIAQKVEKVPGEKHKRVMRFMGREQVMTPGEDSLQNEFILAAGGIPPRFGKKGEIVGVTLEEWQRFDPQVIYGCGGDREVAEKFFSQPGWKDVEAVRTGRIVYFPCALTCRASVHTGEFVGWLAATIYEDEFASGQARVLEEKLLRTIPLDIPLSYVRSARIDETSIFDFPNKTLVVAFKEPMHVTSTLEGERQGILAVGNHYSPPACWGISHRLGFEGSRSHIYKNIGIAKETSCFLFTGADMGNLSVKKEQYRDMIVYALVTAGVESNAVRMSVDEGRFYEPGTINVILMTNMKLSSRARTRAIISATEAKTAAMEDLDVRSSASPQRNQATGTGTDEVLVVEGTGTPIENAGGHCKMGELIAKAVYDGVKEAVYRQNAITTGRSVFRRLQERHFDLHGLLGKCDCPADQNKQRQDLARLEELLQPHFASFIEAAFAISDAYERGQITSLEPFQWWCQTVRDEIAGTWIEKQREYITSPEIPIVMRMCLNALLNGMAAREKQ